MLFVANDFVKRLDLNDFDVVADFGLMNTQHCFARIEQLQVHCRRK
jgi:hypothetical protein